MLQKIAIKMLGDFSVVADGRCVVDATAKLTKPWQLFCYLALNREHVTPSSVLLQELWGGEELADPANVLKNTVYALRRELAGPVKPAESPILFRAGGYCLNGHIKWSVDTERFEQLCEKAERCTGGSEAKWQPGAKRRERSGENCCPSWPVRCG
ncbi:MAG: AfsR/SARP family transcriptional regulator [Ruthenibacterium lactatiformans]